MYQLKQKKTLIPHDTGTVASTVVFKTERNNRFGMTYLSEYYLLQQKQISLGVS